MDIKMGRKKVNEVAEQSSATSKRGEPGKQEKKGERLAQVHES